MKPFLFPKMKPSLSPTFGFSWGQILPYPAIIAGGTMRAFSREGRKGLRERLLGFVRVFSWQQFLSDL